jgi:hypothetical protein
MSKDTTTEAEQTKRRRPILEARFEEAAGTYNTWRAVPEVPFEHLLERSYWVHNARKVRPFDRIVVDADDGSYTAILIVRSKDHLGVDVAVLFHMDLGAIDTKLTASEFTTAFKGPVNKWCVVHADDEKKILKKGLDTREAALGWLAKNANTRAA